MQNQIAAVIAITADTLTTTFVLNNLFILWVVLW